VRGGRPKRPRFLPVAARQPARFSASGIGADQLGFGMTYSLPLLFALLFVSFVAASRRPMTARYSPNFSEVNRYTSVPGSRHAPGARPALPVQH